VLLFSLCGAAAFAQTFSLISQREPIITLNGPWRFHIGDDSAWASMGFDDSQWPLVRSDKSWTDQGYPAFSGYAWYRFKVELPGDGKPVALLVDPIVNGYRVYANGRLIGKSGSADPTWNPVFESDPKVYPLPPGNSGLHTVVIAIRVWTYRPIASWFGAGSVHGGNRLGDADELATRARLEINERSSYYASEYAYSLLAALVGVAILALFLYRPSDKEYLWFSLLLLASFADTAFHLMLNLGSMHFVTWRSLTTVADAVSVIASLEFFAIVLRQTKSLIWWIAWAAAAASPLPTLLICMQWTSMGLAYSLTAACLLPALIWVIAALLIGAFKRDMNALLLLAPVSFFNGLSLLDLAQRIAWQVGIRVPAFDFRVSDFPFDTLLVDVAGYIFILALLMFLVRRFSLARQREERLASVMEAARTIQSLLIPAEPPATPGFSVDSIYLPAQEVGGDFFRILPRDDGSLLLVIGDVSGKGLRAAMSVSATMGALRGCGLYAPAEVLAYLNRVLNGQVSGFVTCCAALLTADCQLIIANAGHLPPYRNGEELSVDSGLPLGIAWETAYVETIHALSPGDQLTFISDGIVEARDRAGALFGFDRMRTISRQPAEDIAQAARAFGQEDDITVLTVIPVPIATEIGA